MTIVICLFLLISSKSYAFLGDGGAGWAQIPYLAKILVENVKRYQQLRMMIKQVKNRDQYIRLLNAGIENSIGLLESLPIKDQKILGELKNFKQSFDTVQNIYGSIPKSPEEALQRLQDQTVAESINMANSLKEYSKKQERNALNISEQSRRASPKGASRMNTQVNAQILHTLNQLLKVNGQILKLQSEMFALKNKEGKESVGNFQKVNDSIANGKNYIPYDFDMPKF